MIAAVYDRYGPPDVVHLAEVPTPEPKSNVVRIRTHAATVSSGDWRVRSLSLPPGFGPFARLAFGVFKPRQPILGTELAGVIDAVGSEVTKFKVGEAVFAFGGAGLRCHAQYRCIAEDGLIVRKPANLSDDEAAALSFGGTTVLDFFRRAALQRGERILINGASGTVGSAAVQIAKQIGAEVTAVCSAANAELVRSLGADQVIDYAHEDFAKSGKTYDVIVDTVGTAPLSRCRPILKDGGRLLLILAGMRETLLAPWHLLTSGKKVIVGPAAERVEDLRRLAQLAESGQFTPVIDQVFPMEQIVEAHRRVDTGHKRGSVVVRFA